MDLAQSEQQALHFPLSVFPKRAAAPQVQAGNGAILGSWLP